MGAEASEWDLVVLGKRAFCCIGCFDLRVCIGSTKQRSCSVRSVHCPEADGLIFTNSKQLIVYMIFDLKNTIHTRLYTFVGLVFAAILLLTVTGCSPHVDFVVPDGFRGAIYIIADPTNGVAIKKRDGIYTVTIPSGGKLRVHDIRFLERWHWEDAHFAGGKRIPTASVPSTGSLVSSNTIALRGGSAVNAGEIYHMYFIGTEPDFYESSNYSVTAP